MSQIGVGVMDKRPPLVQFREEEYGRNIEASQTAGRPIPRIVTMACITPAGSRDELVQPAEEWLAKKKAQAIAGDFPAEWYRYFELAYEEYKKGNELPREGTPIQTWSACSNEQRMRLKTLRITTVEDLAVYPDGALGAIGLDGRHLRDLARAWINEAKDKGINARELADAKARIAELEAERERDRVRLTNLESRLLEEPRRGPGRPRKDEAA